MFTYHIEVRTEEVMRRKKEGRGGDLRREKEREREGRRERGSE